MTVSNKFNRTPIMSLNNPFERALKEFLYHIMGHSLLLCLRKNTEAVARRCSVKKVSLKISQIHKKTSVLLQLY